MFVNNILQKNFTNTRVLVRVDFNIPIKDGKILDNARILQSKPTIDYLLNQQATVILLSHFGRPKSSDDADCSIKKLLTTISATLGNEVQFISNYDEAVTLSPGLYILENVRYYNGEVENDADLVSKLAKLGDYFVNDAFSVCHRNHASVVGLANNLPAYIGLSLQSDIDNLIKLFDKAQHPLMAIIGGSKVSTKITVLENLIYKADILMIAGGMANTFLKAQGYAIGHSLIEESYIKVAEKVIKEANKAACDIVLPSDCVVTKDINSNVWQEVPINQVASDDIIVDIGSQTLAELEKALANTKTVIWNGPLGVYETSPFDNGTKKLAEMVAARTVADQLESFVGGGDSLAALQDSGLLDKVSYACTAGGAFIEWLAGNELPGLTALKQK